MNFLNRLIIWFMSRMAKNQIGRFDFGVVYFGSHKALIVAYKHPYILILAERLLAMALLCSFQLVQAIRKKILKSQVLYLF